MNAAESGKWWIEDRAKWQSCISKCGKGISVEEKFLAIAIQIALWLILWR